MPLIGCVPNISEGRDKATIVEISEAIVGVRGVRLLNVSSDPEQNRSVLTFVGKPTALGNAVRRMFEVAIEKIDVSKNKGKHPRIGAVDVVPFVPLRDTTLERTTQLARKVAREIGDHFHLPVYLYADAATVPARNSIHHIREGEFEGFRKKIKLPEWKPDFGPAKVHPSAGVVAVGSRYPLIAANLLLETKDFDVATRIAENLRSKYFDPQLLKAIVINKTRTSGIKIAVSILNYKKVKLYQVIEAVELEAKKQKTSFQGTELVGLVTSEALFDCIEHYLKLINFDERQLLEHHIPWAKKN